MVLKTFAFHKPSASGIEKIATLREAYSHLLDTILDNCPSSRERAVAITELETSAMWAVKSTVANDPESEAYHD